MKFSVLLITIFLVIWILQYTIALSFNIKIFKIKRNKYLSAALYGVYATFVSSITIPLIAYIGITFSKDSEGVIQIDQAIWITIVGALANALGSFTAVMSLPIIYKKRLEKESSQKEIQKIEN